MSLYGGRAQNPQTFVLPGMRSPPTDRTADMTGTGAWGMPSISSTLFPQGSAMPSGSGSGSTFGGMGEDLYEPGIGRPPVAKRARSGVDGKEGAGRGRNATGRNVSGKLAVSREEMDRVN